MNETRSNSRTKPMRGDFKGGEINSLKDSEKTNDNNWLYYPILDQIDFIKPPKIIYYELRVWVNHNIISMHVFNTLKEARHYYKKYNLSIKEEEGKCFVEIIKIDNLNRRYR